MDLETRTVGRISARLVPLLIVCYFVAYLDRVNVGFAALTMNKDLGISSAAFGLGAGIFFLTYFVFEVPSNLILNKVGARIWIARIMLTWGILSGTMAFIQGETSYYTVRLLLGAAEAGFFPGIIFYLTLWFPAAYRARIIGYFMAAIPLSGLIGNPISGWLLGMHGLLGLKGWQWLFIMEALPAIILSVVVYFYLTDRPADASWLAQNERAWLVNRLELEQRQREKQHDYTVMQALTNRKVLALSLVYFGDVAALYGLGFFLPQIVKAFGLSNQMTGYVTAIPYLAGTIGMIYWGIRSDRKAERKGHTAVSLFVASAGIAVSVLVASPVLKMIALCVASLGIFGTLPVFWTLPTAFLSGAAAAGGIAIINALGNLAGFFGPSVTGYLRQVTGDFTLALLVLAACPLVAMFIVLGLGHDARLERAPEPGQSPAE